MPRRLTIEEQFRRFHATHPDVYDEFVRMALDLRRRGQRHYSADAICHVIRYHRITSGKDASGFKINNNYTALYARMAIDQHPQLGDFFTLVARRTLRPRRAGRAERPDRPARPEDPSRDASRGRPVAAHGRTRTSRHLRPGGTTNLTPAYTRSDLMDMDYVIRQPDDPVYWVVYEESLAKSESEHTIDFERAKRRAHELAAEQGKATRVMRDAGIVASVWYANPDGTGHPAGAKYSRPQAGAS